MTKEKIQQLYREKVLPENRAPYHFGKPEDPCCSVQAYNSMCGDKFQLYPKFGDSTIDSIYFDGFGCAISKASTSILLRKIEGRTLDQVRSFCQRFLEALEQGKPELLDDQELVVLAELKNFEGRVDCIKLSWEALLEDLKKR